MKVASGILPFGGYCSSPLSLDFNNSGLVALVTFIDIYQQGWLVVDLCELSQVVKTCFKHIPSSGPRPIQLFLTIDWYHMSLSSVRSICTICMYSILPF